MRPRGLVERSAWPLRRPAGLSGYITIEKQGRGRGHAHANGSRRRSRALYEADIRESHAVQRTVEVSCRQAPVPSVFVCNAGIGRAISFFDNDEERLGPRCWPTNLTGTFHCLRAMALLSCSRRRIDRGDWIACRVPRLNGTRQPTRRQKPVSSVSCILRPKSGERATSV